MHLIEQVKKAGGEWEEYEEEALNELGDRYDEIVKGADKEKTTGFATYFQ